MPALCTSHTPALARTLRCETARPQVRYAIGQGARQRAAGGAGGRHGPGGRQKPARLARAGCQSLKAVRARRDADERGPGQLAGVVAAQEDGIGARVGLEDCISRIGARQ